MGHSRGALWILASQAFADRTAQREADDALPLASLGENDRALLSAVEAEAWYPSAAIARGIAALGREPASGAAAEPTDDRWLEEVGARLADLAVDGPMRLRLRLARPSQLLANLDAFWRPQHDSGEWTARLNGGHLLASLRDWAIVDASCCRVVSGWIEQLYRRMGRSNVVVEHSRCRARGADTCRFEAWGDGVDEPRASKRFSVEELRELGPTLASVRELDALGPLVCELLTGPLGASYAAIWMRPLGGGDASCVAASGGTGIAPSRYALVGGATDVGWLEIAYESPSARKRGLAALEPLLPLLAVSIDRARLLEVARPLRARTTRADSERNSVMSERDRNRLKLARERWRLTPRETQVLAIVMRGKSNKEIAVALSCTISTVEVHVSRLLKKAGTDGRTGLLAKYWKELGG
jgi:DNA-binding CsgD family transcriptional regulator